MEIHPRVTKSYALYDRANEIIPGGTQLISRRPNQYAAGVSPVYAQSAKGARFHDVDGNEYIDWVSGIRSIILGYADPVLEEAVVQQVRLGNTFSINHPVEVELAEKLIERIPCAEMVRFAKGGGDACSIAARIARGASGKTRILFCGYHGWHDWYLAANHADDDELGKHLLPGIDPTGVPDGLRGTAVPFEYGNLTELENKLDEFSGDVAAVIMEPMRSHLPPEGYLEAVRQLASRHGVILVFDEVSTGFRLSSGGIQPALGVVPDMAVFAKCLSNGFPLGAVVGRRDIMESASHMFISSTYWSDAIGLRAGLVTLEEIEKRNIPQHLASVGGELKRKVNQLARAHALPMQLGGVDVSPCFEFPNVEPATAKLLSTLYVQEMALRGVHGYASFCPNGAHGPSEIEATLNAVSQAFEVIAHAWQRGDLEAALQCTPSHPVFRRQVT